MTGLLEILTNKEWMIRPEFIHSTRSLIQNNLNNHVSIGDNKKEMGCRIVYAKEGTETTITEERYSAKDGRYSSSWNENQDDPFINVMFVDGPITRNGGACSYGSVEHRDIMMSAADNANCVGHIFHINTPGGSAWAKNDYQQAIEYARSKKQPVIAFVDGMCCSAGMYLAALCDERYYMHPKDEIGCIGVMAAFYTEADGSKNEFTNETFHELYDPESFDKNREYRDVANDNDSKLLLEELAKLGVEFREDIKKACPNVTEEHLHGKVFDAQDVTGILMDGQRSLGEVFGIVIERGVRNGLQAAKNAMNMLNHNTSVNMKEKYPDIFEALGVESMECTEEGTFFNAELLETLNLAIQNQKLEAKGARELNEQLTAKNAEQLNTIAELEKERNELMAEVNTKAETIATLEKELEESKSSAEEQARVITEKEQQINDLQAQVEELTNNAGEEPKAGEAPANNGSGADMLHQAAKAPQWDPAKSAKDNNEAMKEYVNGLKKQIR